MKGILFFLLITFLSPIFSFSAGSGEIKIDIPSVIIQDIEYSIPLEGVELIKGQTIRINSNEELPILIEDGLASFLMTFQEENHYTFQIQDMKLEKEINPIPLWLSIVPPLLAIFLALIFKEVVSSLLLGIFVGASIIQVYSMGLWGILFGFMEMLNTYLLGALNDSGHLSIIVFSTLIGGMVSVISKNGGMQGVVNRVSKYATNPQSGQFATWFLGIAIFFDDYANTLIVGNTMRPVTDRLKISREKLAYLVDSTAAPMASIAFVTTWIGAELGYIGSGIAKIDEIKEGAYSTFINSLAYSFYPILALIFMLLLIWKQKDFGPMLHAERKARNGELNKIDNRVSDDLMEEFEAADGIKIRSYNAVIPVLIVILGTVAGLIYTGLEATGWTFSEFWNSDLSTTRKLSQVIGNADSYQALLWSSAAGLIAAIKLSVFQKILKLNQAVEASIHGFKTMLPAVTILILAWSLAGVIDQMHTADLLTSVLSDNVSPYLVPAITFLLAAAVAFSTGSSWGTMAILYPLMIPASWEICQAAGMDYDLAISIFHNVVACVLAGSVLGDHCSPISDTTILSSLASSCNHISHVKTQMPYALTVGLVAILFGTIPAAFGLPFWLSLPIATIILYLIIEFRGKKV